MIRILQGDCRDILKTLPDASVQCCVTSPPYYGLRDYGVAGQIGLEAEPGAYVMELVDVFSEVRRVLRDDGTLWLNIGDSYVSNGRYESDRSTYVGDLSKYDHRDPRVGARAEGFKPKDLLMMPSRVALALQAWGWWLRSAIVWHKPNPMPESVTDRPTSAYEMVYLLAKSPKYFFDADAVKELSVSDHDSGNGYKRPEQLSRGGRGQAEGWTMQPHRNIRNVWTIPTQPYPEAHFATFPPELAERCIKAGSREGDTVLDPFAGAFTTAMVADRLRRHAIGVELNPTYCDMARRRIEADAGMFADIAAE